MDYHIASSGTWAPRSRQNLKPSWPAMGKENPQCLAFFGDFFSHSAANPADFCQSTCFRWYLGATPGHHLFRTMGVSRSQKPSRGATRRISPHLKTPHLGHVMFTELKVAQKSQGMHYVAFLMLDDMLGKNGVICPDWGMAIKNWGMIIKPMFMDMCSVWNRIHDGRMTIYHDYPMYMAHIVYHCIFH